MMPSLAEEEACVSGRPPGMFPERERLSRTNRQNGIASWLPSSQTGSPVLEPQSPVDLPFELFVVQGRDL